MRHLKETILESNNTFIIHNKNVSGLFWNADDNAKYAGNLWSSCTIKVDKKYVRLSFEFKDRIPSTDLKLNLDEWEELMDCIENRKEMANYYAPYNSVRPSIISQNKKLYEKVFIEYKPGIDTVDVNLVPVIKQAGILRFGLPGSEFLMTKK